MSEKRPISEVLRICIEALDNANPRPRTHFLLSSIEIDQRLPELLAIVEAAKACTYGHDVTASATVGPCALCALNTALRAAGEEPTR